LLLHLDVIVLAIVLLLIPLKPVPQMKGLGWKKAFSSHIFYSTVVMTSRLLTDYP